MAAGHDRPIASSLMQDAQQLESSYRSWQTRRPQLFHHSSKAAPMASSSNACIFVIADGQEQPVRLTGAIHDPSSSKSLISRSKALSSRGSIRQIQPTKVTDHSGASYTSTSTISLRWYYDDGTQTFPETFYIVNQPEPGRPTTQDQSSWDAILARTAESPSSALAPQANTILGDPRGRDQREKERKEREIVNQKKYEKEKEAQAQRIRDAFSSKQVRAKNG